jgi:phosphatidylglycerophosphate synthase
MTMISTVDIEKSEKLPKNRKYFNVSIIWIFYFRYVIRLLYTLRIPHEVVTLLSISFGIISAYLFYAGAFIWAALALHLKDIFDACDGALARLTGRGHLIGRYLDSLGDFLSLTLVICAISAFALKSGSGIYIFWGALAILSTFMQCSFFNYYQLAYVEAFGIKSLSSKRDEVNRNDLDKIGGGKSKPARFTLTGLRFFYKIIYSWQDRLVKATDEFLAGDNAGMSPAQRYGNKVLMTMQSALCFGTHIFVIIIFALTGKPEYSLILIGTIMNIFLLLLLYLRHNYYKSVAAGDPAAIGSLTE